MCLRYFLFYLCGNFIEDMILYMFLHDGFFFPSTKLQ